MWAAQPGRTDEAGLRSALGDNPVLVRMAGVPKSGLAGPALAGNHSHRETGSTVTRASARLSVLLSLGRMVPGTGTSNRHPIQCGAHGS